MRRSVLGAVMAAAMVVTAGGVAVAAVPAGQSVLVEDFAHPRADAVLADHGLKVFKGDGRISFVTSRGYEEGPCAAGQIQVERMFDVEPYGKYFCFQTSGNQGYLTLEVPNTFLLRGGDKPITATAELPGGTEKTYNVAAGQAVAVEPGEGATMPQAVLVELRFSAGLAPGVVANPATAGTVRIDVGGERACSGTVVQRWWVVTSRSCFTGTADGALANGAPTKPTSVTTGNRAEFKVDKLVPHAQRDLVLARLSTPVNHVTPVPVATTSPAAGNAVTVAGYGRTGSTWASDLSRSSAATVTAAGAGTLALRSAVAGALCKGDAGGPTLRAKSGGGFELLAVHSTSTQGGCFGEAAVAVESTETRVDDIASWIAQTAVEPFEHVMGADWSGDGHADILAVDSAGLLWYYPHNGGGLSPRVQIGNGWDIMRLVTADDWNSDGRADVLAVDYSGYLWYYQNTGVDNRFAPPVNLGGGWGSVKTLMATDWSGDSHADVLAVDTGGTLWYYAHNGNALSAPVSLGMGWGSMLHITAGDWSGDGHADVVAVNQGGQLLYYAHNGPALSPPQVVGVGWAPFAFVSSADWNRDGLADILGVDGEGRLRGYHRVGAGLGDSFFIPGFPQLS